VVLPQGGEARTARPGFASVKPDGRSSVAGLTETFLWDVPPTSAWTRDPLCTTCPTFSRAQGVAADARQWGPPVARFVPALDSRSVNLDIRSDASSPCERSAGCYRLLMDSAVRVARLCIGAAGFSLSTAACGGRTGGIGSDRVDEAGAPADAVAVGIVDVAESSPSQDGGLIDCVEAGGQCLIGDVICTGVSGAPLTCPGGDTPGGVYCCLPGTVDCGQPATTTVVCPSSAASDASCEGFPTVLVSEAYTPPFNSGQDASFATGCVATFPFCANGTLYQCTCTGPGYWNCAEP
jgi:hypothetical protein